MALNLRAWVGQLLETGGAAGQQLGDGAQIPIGIGYAAMAQVGGEGQDLGIYPAGLAIPTRQATDGKGMPQVMDSRQSRSSLNCPIQFSTDVFEPLPDMIESKWQARIS